MSVLTLGLLRPGGLPAFAAVAVLIALYLLDRRRRVVPVASLFLWQQLPATPQARRRFRPDPLFLLRLGLLLALIGGYLRPYLERSGPTLSPVRLILVLDVSASMQAQEGTGTRFDLARTRARALVTELGPRGEVMVLAAAERPRIVLRWTSDHARIRDRLEDLVALDVPTRLVPALAVALGEAAAQPGTRVAVLTDEPRDGHGLDPDQLAVIDWVQVGQTDDNLAVAGLEVVQPPFRRAADATVRVVIRNYAGGARTRTVEATVDGDRWTTRTVDVGGRASVSLSLHGPPRGGVFAVTLGAEDALAVDDRAVGWIDPGTPLDATVVSESVELAAALGRLSGGRAAHVMPAAYEAASVPSSAITVFDRYVPSELPSGGVLFVAPPDNPLCPSTEAVTEAVVVDWDETHPALRGLADLGDVPVVPSRLLEVGPGSKVVVVAAADHRGFPLLVAGEHGTGRFACLGADLGPPLAPSDRLPLLLLLIGTLRWLQSPSGTVPLVLDTGIATLLPSSPDAAVPDGLRVVGAPPVVVAERAGLHRLGSTVVLANLFDQHESDIGRSGPHEWRATVGPVLSSVSQPREFAWWLYALAAALLALEWALWWRRRPA